MEEMDGHEFDGAKAAVDATDEFVDDGAEILVFFDVLTRGNGDLDKDYFADPFGVFCEENFKGVQFLGNTLDVI